MNLEFPYITKKQQSGVIGLVVLMIVLQIILFYFKNKESTQVFSYVVDVKNQQMIDSLKRIANKSYEQQPFNPNFITDAKGFQLGMTTVEIDKLLKFRKEGKFVNSAHDFQRVTGVSDELLSKLKPYFKFPEWTQHKAVNFNKTTIAIKAINLNTATYEQLIEISGIGPYYANVILSEREKLNGFVSLKQLNFIKGLRPEAIGVLKQNTFVKTESRLLKVNVNTASKEQLAKIPYVTSYLAREIVVLRSKQENPLKIEDLQKINNFPLDKLEIIRLYLDF